MSKLKLVVKFMQPVTANVF